MKKTMKTPAARRRGRPSLTGRREVSPTLILRVDADLLDRSQARATRSATTVSAIARSILARELGGGR